MNSRFLVPFREMSSKILTVESINPNVRSVQYAVRGPIPIRASEIEKDLAAGAVKPFTSVVKANIGDCHAMGQRSITFVRQILAACLQPDLLETEFFPRDVKARARKILSNVNGSMGCYSPSTGIAMVREGIANYITQRDQYPASADNIILSNGASSAIKLIMQALSSGKEGMERSGFLVPIPQYPLYSATISELNGHLVGYYLDEDNNWALDIAELKRAITEARGTCVPKAMVVINPGNPTGQVLTHENIRDIIRFCKEERLFILADEVYQHNVYAKGCMFRSFKAVMNEMGPDYSNMELASFMSVSKGFYGECGLRGGYVELTNIDPASFYEITKLQSAQLASGTIGQVALHSVIDPPKPGEPSYDLFMKEKSEVLGSLKLRSELAFEKLNSIPGIKCNQVQGAMYAFPSLELPLRAIEEAKLLGVEPDFYYCSQLLEETGLCVVPGSGFGQRPNTHHFRMTILPSVNDLHAFFSKLEAFHRAFLKKFSK